MNPNPAPPPDLLPNTSQNVAAMLLALSAHIPGVLFQYQLNPDGSTSFPFVSTAIERMYGISRESASSKPQLLEASIYHEDRISLRNSMLHSAATLTPWCHEYRMTLPSGEIIWRALEATPERLSNGAVLWHGSTIDITARKRVEEKLRQREAPWKLALEGIGDGVWEWDLPNNHLTYSSQWKAMLGYGEDEISDHHDEWQIRIHPDDLYLTEENRQRLLDGTTLLSSIEVRMLNRNGQWRWVHSRGIVVERDAKGQPLRIIGTNTDITERKHMELTLRENEERWKFALEGAGDGVWDWDTRCDMLTLSSRSGEILGLAAHELTQTVEAWRQRIHPDDEANAQTYRETRMHSGNQPNTIEFRIRCNDGHYKWVLSRGMVVGRDAQGTPLRMVGTLSDISPRKEAEEALRLTLIELEQRKQEAEDHAAAKTYFLNAASHDLRQPLYAAQLFLDTLMHAQEHLPPQHQKTLGNLSLAINDMSSQLETLLDISRFDMGRMQPCWGDLPLNALLIDLDASYTPTAREAGVSLQFRDTREIVRTDAILLRRLLGNLIDNAIKFAAHGHVLVCARRSARGIRIEVRDNGPGIAPDHRQKIFDEYFQINNPARNPHIGLGLGLAIVQRISHLLDAPLNLRTRMGQGSVFSVTLPEASTPRYF